MSQSSLIQLRRLSSMVGISKTAHQIRRYARKKMPKAWLFYGQTGLGKTTIARILAVSLQCKHQEKFGEPCDKCWKRYDRWPIYELNASDKTGAPELREFISGSEYVNLLGDGRKVYILDEAHQISKAGQNLLLRYLEDAQNKTVWIVCSTEPHKLLKTLRRRLTKIRMEPLNSDGMLRFTKRLLKKTELSAEDLVDALIQRQIDSPGIIAQAVDKYIVGATAEEASNIEADLEIDTKELNAAVIKGDWESVCTLLRNTPNADARGLRASIVGFLRVILLETVEFNQRNKILVKCITRLTSMHFSDDLVIMAALAAELYNICEMFAEYKR